jgi:hypothetical protein
LRRIYHEQWTSKKLDLDIVGLHRFDAGNVNIKELFMSTQHTPGPWGYGEDSDNEWYFEAMSNQGVQLGWVCPNEESTQEANARLIAAAPDLLDALQEIVKCEKRRAADLRNREAHALVLFSEKRIAAAEAAIAKATGENT